MRRGEQEQKTLTRDPGVRQTFRTRLTLGVTPKVPRDTHNFVNVDAVVSAEAHHHCPGFPQQRKARDVGNTLRYFLYDGRTKKHTRCTS